MAESESEGAAGAGGAEEAPRRAHFGFQPWHGHELARHASVHHLCRVKKVVRPRARERARARACSHGFLVCAAAHSRANSVT